MDSEHCKFVIDVWRKPDGSYITQVGLQGTPTGNVEESIAQMTIQLMNLVAHTSDLGFEGTLTRLVQDVRRSQVKYISETN